MYTIDLICLGEKDFNVNLEIIQKGIYKDKLHKVGES